MKLGTITGALKIFLEAKVTFSDCHNFLVV